MAKYKLKELCEFITDGTHQTPEYCGNDGVIFLSSKDVTERKINWDSVKYIPNALHEKLCKRLKPRKNDILLAKNGTTGVAAIVDRDEIFDVYVSLAVLRPLNVVYPKYLLYAINSPVVKRQFDAGLKGVGVPNLHLGVIKETWINVVKKEGQQKVCKVLDKIEKIIELKKQELQLLDELIKARFVEMFGDPIQNSKGWEMSLIEDVVAKEKNALKAGPFGSALKKEYYVESGYKIYGQEQVISGDHTLGDYYIDEARYKMLENCAVQAGDVLISLVGTYGKLLIMPENFEPGIINPRLMKITFDKEKVNPYYFKYFFQSEALKRALSENTHGGTMDILNLGIVRKIEIPLPPLDLQNKFVSFVNQVNKSKVAVQKSLDETQLLFDSLMQKYFW